LRCRSFEKKRNEQTVKEQQPGLYSFASHYNFNMQKNIISEKLKKDVQKDDYDFQTARYFVTLVLKIKP
jgi:hypothetical protein